MKYSDGKLILVINPGSTSTRIAVYQNEIALFTTEITHTVSELKRFKTVLDQREYRRNAITRLLENKGFGNSDFACVVARGGKLRPMRSGTYAVSQRMLDELTQGSDHASSLGALIAHDIAGRTGTEAFIVDPITVDEMDDIARISGLSCIERLSIFHALNQKAVARQAAQTIGSPYNKLNLIVAHLGGGISIGVHKRGRVVDVNNALNGDGPFAPTRTGGLPVWSCIEYALSSHGRREDLKRKIIHQGGMVDYLGTSDLRKVSEYMKKGDSRAELVYKAMAYQVAKEIGSGAAVLSGNVDGIIFTGGLARDKNFISLIKKRVKFIAPIFVYPGSHEMNALAQGALRVLVGKERAKEY
jgi:butyrate kinase